MSMPLNERIARALARHQYSKIFKGSPSENIEEGVEQTWPNFLDEADVALKTIVEVILERHAKDVTNISDGD